MALVSLADAKVNLRIDHDGNDAEIQRLIEQASAIVLDYLKGRANVLWTVDPLVVDGLPVPGPVESATLRLVVYLYEHRGDDLTLDAKLWEGLGLMLMRSRDPAFA